MTNGRRVERVASLIRREISELLMNGIHDQRVHEGIVSITEVEVSGDLQHCKIFVSIYGESILIEDVMDGLHAATGFVRGEIGKRLQMRRAPEVSFQLDRGIEKGNSVLNLLNRLEEQRKDKSSDEGKISGLS